MKRKLFCMIIFFGILTSSAIVTAATGTSIKAILTANKIYYESDKLTGSVLSYKNNNYIPAKILSDDLGYDTEVRSGKLVISEDESKDDLRNEIKGLEKQIKDLNKQMDVYRGFIPDDSAYKTYTKFQYQNTDDILYTSYWNKVTPFKINGMVYDSKTYGIYFKYKQIGGKFYYPTFMISNKDLAYSQLRFSCAADDLAKSFTTESSKVKVFGISSILGTDVLLEKDIDRSIDMDTLEIDIKGYDEIAIVFIPGNEGYLEETSEYNVVRGNFSINEDYILFINPEVK